MASKGFKRVNLLSGLKKSEMDVPFGYAKETEEATLTSKEDKQKREILINQAWSTATSPVSQIFMNIFMFWMMGSSVHIFTLVFMFSILYNSVKTISNTNEVFQKYEGIKDAIGFYKLIYMGLNSVVLIFGLYRLYGMGLLPLHASDYVALVPHMKVLSCHSSLKSFRSTWAAAKSPLINFPTIDDQLALGLLRDEVQSSSIIDLS
jgi:hypothetical protein